LVVVEGAVEVGVAAACEAMEAAFVPDFHGVAEDRIVAQLDRERAKGERDLEEFLPRVTVPSLRRTRSVRV
jgi:uncharacterized membrane-anchored protein